MNFDLRSSFSGGGGAGEGGDLEEGGPAVSVLSVQLVLERGAASEASRPESLSELLRQLGVLRARSVLQLCHIGNRHLRALRVLPVQDGRGHRHARHARHTRHSVPVLLFQARLIT